MRLRFKPSNFFLATGLLLIGCNLFNPDGTGDPGNRSSAQLAEGEALFRSQDYAGAMAAFEAAIRADSANSLAYYGYSKATLRYYRLNAGTIFRELTASDSGGLPFLGSDDETLTRYLQAGSRTRNALALLTDRDTLTRWFDYLSDTTSDLVRRDTHAPARIAFIRSYLDKAGQGHPGYRPRNRFPLTDFTITFDKITADAGVLELLYAVCRLRDLDQNDTIDSRDDLLKKLDFNSDSGITVENLQDIAEELKTDSVARENVNNLIQNVSEGLASAGAILELLGPLTGSSGDSLSNQSLTEGTAEDLDSAIQSLGSAITFYQFGDRQDNDGDGCVDEEIIDGKDNDADGFTDEDARVILADWVDNDRAHGMDLADPGEDVDSASGLLRFVRDSVFIRGPMYQDREFHIRVQSDSLSIRTSLTASQRDLLDSAKAQIGGCWRNYP